MLTARTPRLQLRAIDPAEGQRIADRQPSGADFWADEFPGAGDTAAVGAFLSATAERGDQRPFGYYLITRAQDGLAIGGIGFKGWPHEGCVEIGYGLVPSARGQRYAAEAVSAIVDVAGQHGVRHVLADTLLDNRASRRTLERAGFRHVGTDAELHSYVFDTASSLA